ncbi:7-carboxy-7-deazaguanine synthase QueE [Myxococcota bacterium]|nr:7-carboxy-7-deazaguanine synthase QueE [Myxococcota bacterium]
MGSPTVFVRFGECDLRCRWCDTPHTWTPVDHCRFQDPHGGPDRVWKNPVSLESVLEAITELSPRPGDFVSLTGGEPLLQAEWVTALSRAVRTNGLRAHLETHGLAVDGLSQIGSRLDVISMDWKAPADVRNAVPDRYPDFAKAHREFLGLAKERADSVYVKWVLSDRSTDSDLEEVCRAIEDVAPETPLILQPVTPAGGVRSQLDASVALNWLRLARDRLRDVRMIPQTHPLIGVR